MILLAYLAVLNTNSRLFIYGINLLVLLVVLFLIPVFVGAQTIENLDFISPFNDGLSAIKKDNQWAFINQEGSIVLNFRNEYI